MDITIDYALLDPNGPLGNLVAASLTGPSVAFNQMLASNMSGSIVRTLSAGTYGLLLDTTTMKKPSRDRCQVSGQRRAAVWIISISLSRAFPNAPPRR